MIFLLVLIALNPDARRAGAEKAGEMGTARKAAQDRSWLNQKMLSHTIQDLVAVPHRLTPESSD
jgi:hypothetical protein